jgi:hypothetical protein
MGKAIVNAHNGKGWYPRGQERLRQSLQGHPEALCFYQDYPNDLFKGTNHYYLKPSAMYEASKPHSQLLWMDSSCWVIKDLAPIWDAIEKDGYYFIHSGFNCAQYCNDESLEYFGITRDEAEKIPMIYAICFGVDLQTDIGAMIWGAFQESALKNIFDDGHGSCDSRFIAHRHDQSALSLIAHSFGCKIHDVNIYNSTNVTNPPESVAILMQGM